MSDSDLDDFTFTIDMAEISCIYFCGHFYKTFKERMKIMNVSILKNYKTKKVLCCCSSCKDKINKHFQKYNTSNDQFFFFLRQGNF